ncbi:MAG TPA: DNA-formamidopyrimidine glycosylase family protein [Dermatophilaceae bacterium]|nr:DNA-formamidopyrimidine glycosylase family protein [Dermatophilaceae bacterium]
MPEGDTVWRTAQRLHAALAGQPLQRAELRWPSLAEADLRGARTLEVISRGKHLVHRLDTGLTLHSHLRMEGQWRIEDTATLPSRATANPQLRALLGTQRWTALGLRLGMLDLVATTAEDELVGHLGPDVLGPDWDAAEAARRLAGSGTDIAAALLDQRHLAGVGTMYAAEALFLERLHPWTPAGSLTPEALDRLVARAHQLLDHGRQAAVQSTTGSQRRGETHYVHARSGLPCRRCGEPVRVAPTGPPTRERTIFYCPRCQGGLGPTDAGRPQRPLGSSGPRRDAYRAR